MKNPYLNRKAQQTDQQKPQVLPAQSDTDSNSAPVRPQPTPVAPEEIADMPPAASAYSAYRSAEVETLTQRDLIIKLYQGAERFLVQAKIGDGEQTNRISHRLAVKS